MRTYYCTKGCFDSAFSRVGKTCIFYTDITWIQLSSVKLGLLSWNI